MKIKPLFYHVLEEPFLHYITLLILFISLLNCGTVKDLDKSTILYTDNIADTVTVRQSQIPVKDTTKIEELITAGLDVEESLAISVPKILLQPEYPVARQVLSNYLESKNKEPGGHCLTASKKRFLKAYEDVYGHSVYENLPDSIATKYYDPAQVFDHLYASTSGRHRGWRSLPRKFRGKGSAGAIAQAGMGKLVDTKGVWSGKLRPGAPMQVWRHKQDYRHVVRGISDPKIDPFGHSFIFLGYVRNEAGKIIGIKIADQGYQSNRTLVPRDYEVWWGVNLEI
ncbi:hypothetical protein [Costertonia aggregata]|uniref:Uncharacterized protein n=1 Tax=Costertonia aggregata TaxID=343403 RepID=A0A7H9ASU6_9FLAO|nr:hypothetical protein [Costertonia aggregata]QLG46519.1 hypothetical protein HYG79_14575 [Costertonia aggregata]